MSNLNALIDTVFANFNLFDLLTLDREKAIEQPTINKNQGITTSARVIPFQGEWFMWGYAPPASSTKIIIKIVRPLKPSKDSNLVFLGGGGATSTSESLILSLTKGYYILIINYK